MLCYAIVKITMNIDLWSTIDPIYHIFPMFIMFIVSGIFSITPASPTSLALSAF